MLLWFMLSSIFLQGDPQIPKMIMTKDYFLIILLQFSHICVIDWIDIGVNSHHVLMFPLA